MVYKWKSIGYRMKIKKGKIISIKLIKSKIVKPVVNYNYQGYMCPHCNVALPDVEEKIRS